MCVYVFVPAPPYTLPTLHELLKNPDCFLVNAQYSVQGNQLVIIYRFFKGMLRKTACLNVKAKTSWNIM